MTQPEENMTPEIKTSEASTSSNTPSTNNDTVAYSTYSKLLNQRKEDQAKLRQVQEQLNKINLEKEAEHKKNLEEQGKYKDLWETSQKQLMEERRQSAEKDLAALNNKKQQAFREVVGELANPDYKSFIDLSRIKTDEDGEIIKESLEIYGNWFKENHAPLMKSVTREMKPNQQAPKNYTFTQKPKDPQTQLAEMLESFKASGHVNLKR